MSELAWDSLSTETLRRLEHASGRLATGTIGEMEERLPWFRRLPADKDMSRWVSLRQTVELVRVALEVFERMLPEIAADEKERAQLTEAVLRYGREIAFAAATSYAAAAEARGAWDARLEALIVDGIVSGDAEESRLSRAWALGGQQSADHAV